MEGKYCPRCSQVLPVENFGRNKSRNDGLAAYCRTCKNASSRESQERNRPRARAFCRASYAKNRNARIERVREYQKRNPDKRKEWNRKRMALKRDALYLGHTTEDLEQKLQYYGGKCWICRAAEHEHWDHVKPLSKGGAHILANLRPSCAACNISKSDKWPFYPAMILQAKNNHALAA